MSFKLWAQCWVLVFLPGQTTCACWKISKTSRFCSFLEVPTGLSQWCCYYYQCHHHHHHHHHHHPHHLAIGQMLFKDQISSAVIPVFKVMVLWMNSSEVNRSREWVSYRQEQCCYKRDSSEIPYSFPAWEHSQKTSVCGPWRMLTRCQICQSHDLRLPSFQNCGKGTFVARSPPAYSVPQNGLQGYLASWHCDLMWSP